MNLCLAHAVNSLAGQNLITCGYDLMLLEASTKHRNYSSTLLLNVLNGGQDFFNKKTTLFTYTDERLQDAGVSFMEVAKWDLQ